MSKISKNYQERQKEFLLTAQKLFYEKGYEQTSVNDILTAMNSAKGTFYHYFKSKEELLNCLVEMKSKEVVNQFRSLVEKSATTALEKLNSVFSLSKQWKVANKQLVQAMVRVMYNKDNLLLRNKLKESNIRMTAPLLSEIIIQGVKEGAFRVPCPEDSGEFIIRMGHAINDMLADQYLLIEEDPKALNTIKARLKIWNHALEAFLGAPQGSIQVADEAFIDSLFK